MRWSPLVGVGAGGPGKSCPTMAPEAAAGMTSRTLWNSASGPKPWKGGAYRGKAGAGLAQRARQPADRAGAQQQKGDGVPPQPPDEDQRREHDQHGEVDDALVEKLHQL